MIKINPQSPAQTVQKNVEQIQDDIRSARPEHGWQETGATQGGALRRLFRTLTSPLRALLRKLSPQRAARQQTTSTQFAATVAQSGTTKPETSLAAGQFTRYLRSRRDNRRTRSLPRQDAKPHPPRRPNCGKSFGTGYGIHFASCPNAKPHHRYLRTTHASQRRTRTDSPAPCPVLHLRTQTPKELSAQHNSVARGGMS